MRNKCHWNLSASKFNSNNTIGKSIFDEVVERMGVAVVDELVVNGRKFLEALKGDVGDVMGEFGVFGEDHHCFCNKAIDQQLLPYHFFLDG